MLRGQSGVGVHMLGASPLKVPFQTRICEIWGVPASGPACFTIYCPHVESMLRQARVVTVQGEGTWGAQGGPRGPAMLGVRLLHLESWPVFTEMLPLLPAGEGGPGPGPEL